jgi:signal transduction histidine kinase/ligand-binding sensor domain-containing protein/DNA-binding response OmpR family regulator
MRRGGKKLLMFALSLLFLGTTSYGTEVERFEHINSAQGLSQNAVLCLFCDSEGYLWIGTMNGLNRFDGYDFRIFKTQDGLSNNRVVSIQEDMNHFLWVGTYDGYYHCYDKERETFQTWPFYRKNKEEKNSVINCFHQADSSQIWLGSRNSGLYRLVFNPKKHTYETTQILSRGNQTITNNHVNFIFTDSEKKVWVGTESGLNLIRQPGNRDDDLKIEHFFIDASFTQAIEVGTQVWFGTEHKGIFRFDLNKNEFSTPESSQLFSTATVNLFRKIGRDLIIGTKESGCFYYSEAGNKFYEIDVNGKYIKNIFTDKRGFVWITTEEYGVDRYSPQTAGVVHYELSPENIQPLIDDERLYFFEDNKNQLWIACHGGGLALYDYEAEKFTFYRNQTNSSNSISSNFVHCITQDKSGNYWVGTSRYEGGLNKIIFNNPAFRNVVPKNEAVLQAENEIRTVFEDSRRNLWVASRSGMVHIYNPLIQKTGEFKVSEKSGNNVYSIFEDAEHYIWIGTKPGGLYISQKPVTLYREGYSDIKFDHYTAGKDSDSSLGHDNVYSIVPDCKGRIWIGTYGKGLNIAVGQPGQGKRFKQIHTGNSNLSSDYVREIFRDSKGNFWIATVFGLNFLSKENFGSDDFTFETYLNDPSNEQSISYNDIIRIYEDSEGNIWVSTFGNGLNKIIKRENGQASFEHYTQATGLANDIVYGILEDHHHNLWFSTESGLSVYYPGEKRFETFRVSSGLYSQGFLENACCRLQNNILAFGATYGFVLVDPDKLQSPQYFQNLVLNSFQILNTEYNLLSPNPPLKKSILFADEIVLKYNQASFSFEFSALNLTAPELIQYAIKLENYDDDWNYSGNNRTATYKNIPSGEYVFRVKATNPNGVWNLNEKQIKLIVLPPWWRTKLAYSCYLILLLLAADATRRIVTKYNRMRTDLKVERRVNEIKLKFFTNISHEIRTPLTLIMGPINDILKIRNLPPSISQPLELMNRNGKRMLRLVNQLLDFRKIQNQKMILKAANQDIIKFVGDICSNFNQLALQKNIRFSYPVDEPETEAWFDSEKIDSVLFNLLSNAFKFTPEGKAISVSVASQPEQGIIQIKIEDEGKGISKEKLPLLFQRFTSLASENIDFSGTGIGLAYSYELVKLHKGDIKVESVPGSGSCFVVELPTGNQHFSEAELLNDNSETRQKFTHASEYDFSAHELSAFHPLDEQVKKHLVLIVEDNAEVRFYVAGILDRFFHIATATNGAEGLEQAAKIYPDLIVTDLIMPEMDGISMVRRLKENFSLSHIPVVMLTAKSGLHEQIEGVESGAEAYVLKPFDAEYLVKVISNLLKQREIIFSKFQNQLPLSADIKITNRDEEFLKNIIATIEKNCADPEFNVEHLVKECVLGRTVFYNKIKGLTGLTPVEFLRKTRLHIAARYLAEPGYRVNEAASFTGFNDVKYFSRCFKTEFGVLPSEYIKTNSKQ